MHGQDAHCIQVMNFFSFEVLIRLPGVMDEVVRKSSPKISTPVAPATEDEVAILVSYPTTSKRDVLIVSQNS